MKGHLWLGFTYVNDPSLGTMETERKWVVARFRKEGASTRQRLLNGYEAPFGGDKNVWELDTRGSCAVSQRC